MTRIHGVIPPRNITVFLVKLRTMSVSETELLSDMLKKIYQMYNMHHNFVLKLGHNITSCLPRTGLDTRLLNEKGRFKLHISQMKEENQKMINEVLTNFLPLTQK